MGFDHMTISFCPEGPFPAGFDAIFRLSRFCVWSHALQVGWRLIGDGKLPETMTLVKVVPRKGRRAGWVASR